MYNETYDDKENIKEEQQKLTKWDNEPTLADLKNDYDESIASQDTNVRKITDWKEHLRTDGAYYEQIKSRKGKSGVTPQLIRKQAEWRYAALSEPFLSVPDLYDIAPVSWEDRAAANQNSLILNNQFNTKINKVKLIDSMIRALVDEGTAILRVGWAYEEKEVDEKVYSYEYTPLDQQDQEAMQMFQEILVQAEKEPDSFTIAPPEIQEAVRYYDETGEIVSVKVTGETTKKVTKASVNHPTVEVCDYRNVYLDPTCGDDLDKANFVVYTFNSSLAELEKDGKYTNLDKIDLNNETSKENILSAPDDSIAEGIGFKFNDKPRQKFTVYEYWGYWDINDDGIVEPIVATWVGNTLIRLEENPYPDGDIPFVVIPYLPVQNSLYGESDGSLLIDNQKIIGAVTRGIIDSLGKSANAQRGISKSLLDATNRRRFENGQDYNFNPGADPRQHVIEHTFPEIPNSALNVIQMMNADAESLTGVKSFATGGGITGANLGDTAAGVRGALDASSKRELGILRRISNGIIDIGRKFISMNSEFLEEQEIVRVTNEKFIAVRRDDLAGEFDLRLTISTAEADKAKSDQLSFMLQTMGNNLPPEMTYILLSEIARLNKMPDLAHEIENYEPQPDPVQQQLQQLEIQKLQAEIQLISAQAQEAMTKAGLNESKYPVEQARAAEMASRAESKNVDTQENVHGIKHNRELEKIKANEQANINKQRMMNATALAKQDRQAEADLQKSMALEAMRLQQQSTKPNEQ